MEILEELASLIIREYREACEQESNWCNSDDQRAIETNEAEDSTVKKLPKQSSDLLDPTLSIGGSLTCATDKSNDQTKHEIIRKDDTHPLIPAIGRDNSLSCILRCSRADYGSIACLNSGFHSLVNSGGIYKLRRQFGVVEHWVYFSCQPLEWEAFDPIRRQWMRVPKMEHSDCFVHADKETLAVGTEILVFGQDFMSHVIYRYSLLTNAWTIAQSMNQQRCSFASASFGEKAIVAGGCDSEGNILSSAELYDSKTQAWKKLKDMNNPRKMCSGAFMDNKFYVIGGVGEPDLEHLMSGEEYDLETETWSEIPNMSPVRRIDTENNMPESPPLIAVVKDELFAAHYGVVRKYAKKTGRWITVGRLPQLANSMFGWDLAFKGCGDRLVVISGPRHAGVGLIEVNSWVPNDYPVRWETIGLKQSGSFVHNCVVMGC